MNRDLLPHDSVGAIIRDSEGKILMLHHKKYNLWTIPVGKVEPGEDSSTAISRELNEELGMSPTMLMSPIIKDFEVTYRIGDVNVTSRSTLYEVHKHNNIPFNKEPDKHYDMRYISIEDIIKLRDVNAIGELTKKYLEFLETK